MLKMNGYHSRVVRFIFDVTVLFLVISVVVLLVVPESLILYVSMEDFRILLNSCSLDETFTNLIELLYVYKIL